MNNKKIFSVKMFWQSFLQLKVIGFISTILMVLITCVPICISAVNIKSNIEYGFFIDIISDDIAIFVKISLFL